jgi:hypothetical protein
MSYSTYLQAEANRCRQFADEGACLARVARRGPVTIMPGFSGLGQTDTASALAARSAELIALQNALVAAGALTLRTVDGVISSASSPTLASIRAWATSHGLSATGTARTSSGGLTIPSALLTSIIGAAPAGGGASGGKTGGAATTESETGPSGGETSIGGGMPRWLPWAAGGAVVLLLGAVVVSRRR